MASKSDLVSIGDVLGAVDFWKPNTLEEEVAKFKGRNDLYKDADGILRCKKCHEPRVFYLEEAKRWLPCACKCCGKESQDDFQERIAQLKAESGIEGRNAKADFDDCEITAENEEVFNSCLRFAMNWKQVKQNGMGMYLYGDKDTGKTFLACCIANMLLDAGKLRFTRDDLLDLRPFQARQLISSQLQPALDAYHGELVIYRIGDSQLDNLKIPKEYNNIVGIQKFCTLPELEMLLIIAEGLFDEYKKVKSTQKPKNFL